MAWIQTQVFLIASPVLSPLSYLAIQPDIPWIYRMHHRLPFILHKTESNNHPFCVPIGNWGGKSFMDREVEP